MLRPFLILLAIACFAPDCLAQSGGASEAITLNIGETEVKTDDGTVTVDSLRIDLNSPTVAAGAVIGADDIALTNVRASTDLTAQLLSGFDANGVLQAGIAFGGSPYLWSNPRETREHYQRVANTPVGFLKRTEVGFATKQVPNDSGNGVAAGVSLSWELLSQHDLRFAENGYECLQNMLSSYGVTRTIAGASNVIREALAELKRQNPGKLLNLNPADGLTGRTFTPSEARDLFGINPGGQTTPFSTSAILGELELDVAFDAIRLSMIETRANQDKDVDAAWAKFTTNRSTCDKKFENHMKDTDSLVLTAAQGYLSETGKYDNLEAEKTAIYLQYRTGSCSTETEEIADGRRDCKDASPLAKFAHYVGVPLIGLVSYATDETVKISDTVEEKADRVIVGFGTAAEGDDQALDFQISFAQSDFVTARPDAEEFKASISYSRKIAKGIWIEFKAGTKSSDDVSDDSFAGISFKLSPSVVGG